MSTQRVDKGWQQKGLGGYSTEALQGTLGHYGIPMSEADFRKLAESAYPLGIAQQWSSQWKGTGPFKDFVVAAAVELWRRWTPDLVSPVELTESIAGLMAVLSQRLAGVADAPVAPAFERMKALRSKLPVDEKGALKGGFLQEALAPFTERDAELFDGLAESLAAKGHVEDAESFADLEEFLLPDRKGISRAVARAARGEREPAVQDLVNITRDTARAPITRLLAVDGLIHLQANEQAAARAKDLLETAEKEGELHLALDLIPRLEHVFKQQNDRAALLELVRTADRLEAAHDKMHPGHRRHRHSH
ncbi:hypothetical protein KRR26_01830 [Corallococcus sp. M34]|uniref:hypothetical protein n=1 Tax=Citreicoccus inhibens TaxID=2849499 RepID=UPI001C211FC8|nr:hypothetical protein [Citreicoccus inhibens]MBU8894322.1 hypothetical protein [Citreicoccus inhibens]